MTENVQHCLDLTVQIEDLMWERQQLENSLTEDEREELISLLDRMGEAKLNEATQLETYLEASRTTSVGGGN